MTETTLLSDLKILEKPFFRRMLWFKLSKRFLQIDDNHPSK